MINRGLANTFHNGSNMSIAECHHEYRVDPFMLIMRIQLYLMLQSRVLFERSQSEEFEVSYHSQRSYGEDTL